MKVTLSWTWDHGQTRLVHIRLGRRPPDTIIRIAWRGGTPPDLDPRSRPRGLARLQRAIGRARYRAGDHVVLTLRAGPDAPERIEIPIRNGRLPAVRLR